MSWTLSPQVSNGPRYSDKAIFPPSVLADVIDRLGDHLPHPLIFRLHSENQQIYVGVLEFSAPENTIILPEIVFRKLPQQPVTAELVVDIPKGTELSLKPLQFYSQVHNWKFFLESRLPKLYTTLTKHEKLLVEDENGVYELFVENLSANTVCITDTEMVLDVVPLDNVMAQQQLEFSKAISYLEEAASLNPGAPASVDIEPFNSPQFKTQMLKIDIKQCKTKLYIVLESTSPPYNSDIVVGTDKFVGMECYRWSSMDISDDVDRKIVAIDPDTVTGENLYVVPFAWESPCTVKLSVTSTLRNEVPPNSEICSNCGKAIAKETMVLHQAHCFRHNIKCECGSVFPEKIPPHHWHCEQCSAHGNAAVSKSKHDKMNHMGPYKCDKCGFGAFATFSELVTSHKAVECPDKLHECQFCHMIVPQEESTYQDRYLGLTHHENWCGNRTVECFRCSKVLRSKDMSNHLQMHELDKMEMTQATKLMFTKCSNMNCVNAKDSSNILGMCSTCFGPLYVQQHDPTGIKLQSRIERRYMLQLTKGCGFSWCQNQECCSGLSPKLSVKEAIDRVRNDLLPEVANLPINKDKSITTVVWFCVNESVQRRKNMVDAILSEGEYDAAVVYKAANEERNEGIREWLQTHAVKR
ncbi:hypothetical protein JA9_004627 [Meyerozyma sp. JA9]|nr:hypothetical protein JA9_004627 [Meyerozyma sp. JA9]